ncbi:peptidase M75 [Thalassobius vesicularis]|uniref:Peptidase M75 n=1 Tax=Thalassobius vesicularis TaxID=1294297 RepID=A0A4S3M988_9RHOB|nr:imelysin family protein [Thalassobius vesicularis]THD72631.1 peptidase M75 [Thalassobius vesicularis]
MLKPLLTAVLITLPFAGWAEQASSEAEKAVHQQILPGFAALAAASARMSDAAATDCAPTSQPLRTAWNAAFDDWIKVSHLRFGPTETENRAFALAYWPDSRGTTPKTLKRLIAERDPIITSPDGMESVSVAARGFYAMEYVLFDPAFQGDAGYACALTRALSADIAAKTAGIARDWRDSYAALMMTPGSTYSPYQTPAEVTQELYKALATGLEFTSDARLNRPLGSFDKPRPGRAEARLSGRSQRHVVLSLQALKQLAVILSEGDQALQDDVSQAFDTAISQAEALDDPIFAGVEDPQKRLKIEILQQTVKLIREQQLANIGNKLGVAAGFNALDGD